jgi:hypothetical protein
MRVVKDPLGTKHFSEFIEGTKSSRRKSAAPPDCVLASEKVKRRKYKLKILYVGPENICKTQKLLDLVNVDGRGGISDGGELIEARQNTVRS